MKMGVEKKVYSFRLEIGLVEDLQIYAKQENRKLSNLVETVLKRFRKNKRQEKKLPGLKVGIHKTVTATGVCTAAAVLVSSAAM